MEKMKNNSIILVDYDTQVLNSFLEPLTQENFTVTIVPFNNLPDIPIQPNCVLTTVLLCNKLDDIVRKKVEDLTFYSGMKIALISDIIDHSFISSLKQRDLIDRIDFFKDIFQLLDWLKKETKLINSHSNFYGKYFNNFISHFIKKSTNFNRHPGVVTNSILTTLPEMSMGFLANLHLHASTEMAKPELAIENNDLVLDTLSPKKTFKVTFFGGFSIQFNNKSLVPKNNAVLLAFLLLNHNKKHYRTKLIEKFWPDSTYESARNCLNAAICNLRKILGDFIGSDAKIIIYENDYYSINLYHFDRDLDVDNFYLHWEAARTLIKTKNLSDAENDLEAIRKIYVGEFMPNSEFSWIVGNRDDFTEKYLQVLNWLAEIYWQAQNFTESIEINNEILKIDECVESTHCRLMLCYLKLNLTEKAIRQYYKFKEITLKMHSEPSLEIQKIYSGIVNL